MSEKSSVSESSSNTFDSDEINDSLDEISYVECMPTQ